MCQGHGATEDFSALWKLRLKRPHFLDDILCFLHEYSLILKCKQKNLLKHPFCSLFPPLPPLFPTSPISPPKGTSYELFAVCPAAPRSGHLHERAYIAPHF